MDDQRKNHWEKVYASKQPHEVSWTQDIPVTSLDFIHSFGLSKDARIIDVGGGDSRLVDHLLLEGFKNITVLDISEHAIERARKRLGEKAAQVKWIVSDIEDFNPTEKYDVWHDRATFHFLTTPEQIAHYLQKAGQSVTQFLSIGTFSDQGPDKCSGLPVKKYSEEELVHAWEKGFFKIRCLTEDHITPFQTRQHFLFCSFRKKAA